MTPRRPGLVAGLIVVALAACNGEQQQQAPTGPDFRTVPPSTACDFKAVSSLINSYFTPPQQQLVQSLESDMEAAGAQSPGAVQKGYDIMTEIGKASRSSTPPSVTVGSSLTKALIKCMYDASTSEFTGLAGGQGLDAVPFDRSLAASSGGAYYVRGGPNDSNSVVTAIDPTFGGNFSGVAPPIGANTTVRVPWSTITSQRVLIYGYVLDPVTYAYEWSLIRPNASFNPAAVVAVCDNDGSPTAMVHEDNVGVLAYQGVTDICTAPQSFARLQSGWGPRALAQRLARLGTSLFSAQPIFAYATGSGGTATSFKSKFSKQTVATVTLGFLTNAPSSTVTLNNGFPVQVTVSASKQPVFGVCVYLTGTNNNGQKTDLVQVSGPDSQCTDPAFVGAPSAYTQAYSSVASLADFGQIKVTKTGGLILTATAKAVDRTGTGSVAFKMNVKP